MIEEAYVSFETARLLKEKGFPQEYDIFNSMVYNEEDYEDEYEVQRMVVETKVVKAGTLSSYPVGVPEPKCYCPTQQIAMRWLREVHKLHVSILYSELLYGNEPFYWYIERLNKKPADERFVKTSTATKEYTYRTYEQACEAAIQYSLENLI